MIDVINHADCTGCKMCADVCPNSAISFDTDKKGFWYPSVDDEKCVKCELCIKTCPSIAGYKSDKDNPEVYAAWIKDDAIRLRSTSGAIYYALANRYVSKGEYIAGCEYTDDYKAAFHAISNSEEGLEKIVGSKYFQSDTGSIYKRIKTLLDEDKEVLFCGTPCQSAALQKYLEKSYLNLTTVDFICKGINSPKVYKEYLTELEDKFNSKVKSVHLKNKRNGWQSLGIYVRFQNGEEYFREGKDDLWVQGYVKESLYTRTSCRTCKYKTLPRVSDISLGDFWGVQGMDKKDLFKGISLVMVNSIKGKELFSKIKRDVIFEKRSFDEAVKGNPSIFKSDDKESKSELFFELLNSMRVSEAIENCLEYNSSEKEGQKPITFGGRIFRFFRR